MDAFVKSYNYEDCDGMIDYFDVDFYYFGCCQNNGESIAIVPKTARLKNPKADPAIRKSTKTAQEPQATEEPEKIAEKSGIPTRSPADRIPETDRTFGSSESLKN